MARGSGCACNSTTCRGLCESLKRRDGEPSSPPSRFWQRVSGARESSSLSGAAGYGMPGVIVDGMDVIAVHEAAVEAVERARQGGGPSMIEAKT